MRNWKNWLLPILTALTVMALALLPLRLSVMRDGELTGTVHAEALSEDSNFPFKPPDLPGRVWLMVQWYEMPDTLAIMSQELEGAERDREIQRLQEALADLGTLLPPDMAALLREIGGYSWNWDRCCLRDQTDLSSANFTEASTYDKQLGTSLSAVLDGESGQLLSLQLHGRGLAYHGLQYELSAPELGEALLARMGLHCESAETSDSEDVESWATFRLPECKSWFTVIQSRNDFSFSFALDWSAVEAETAEMYGYPVSGTGATDADSMQKW